MCIRDRNTNLKSDFGFCAPSPRCAFRVRIWPQIFISRIKISYGGGVPMRRTRIWSEISVLVPPPLVSRSEWRFDLKYSYLASKIGIVFWRFSVRTTQIWSQVSDYLPLLSLRVRSEGFIQQHSYLASEIGICGCFGAWIRNLSRIRIKCSLFSIRFENEIKPEIFLILLI